MEQFNQTMVVQAPAGVTEADVVVVLQACWIGMPCCGCASTTTGPGGGRYRCPRPARWTRARACKSVEVLSDEALVGARSRLNPAAGVMLSAVWAAATGQLALIIHHLAVDGVSWRILLEDLNIAWAQHHSGQPVALPAGGTSFARWSSLLANMRTPGGGGPGRGVAAGGGDPGGVAGGGAAEDTYASAGQLSVSLDVETTRLLLGEVPAAFHAGVHDILLIAFGLACAEFLGAGAAPIGIDVEGHGRQEELGADVDLSRTVGWFTTKYPVALASVGWTGRRWSPVRRRWGRWSRTPKSSCAPCPTG